MPQNTKVKATHHQDHPDQRQADQGDRSVERPQRLARRSAAPPADEEPVHQREDGLGQAREALPWGRTTVLSAEPRTARTTQGAEDQGQDVEDDHVFGAPRCS